jgi:hypothetical protein
MASTLSEDSRTRHQKIQAATTRALAMSMSLEILELAEPRDDEILVRLVATGVCRTDIDPPPLSRPELYLLASRRTEGQNIADAIYRRERGHLRGSTRRGRKFQTA